MALVPPGAALRDPSGQLDPARGGAAFDVDYELQRSGRLGSDHLVRVETAEDGLRLGSQSLESTKHGFIIFGGVTLNYTRVISAGTAFEKLALLSGKLS